MIVAITGATGFVGGHVLDALARAGHMSRALARRPQAERPGVEWIAGALDDTPALERLCSGVDAVVHVAGVVNAPDAAGFDAGNRIGTTSMIATTRAVAPDARFVQVSSLAAREPQLSMYGRSKRSAEDAVASSSLDWRVIRPPAIYGPGDIDGLDLFKAARLGIVPLPPPGRLSVIHVADLSRLIVALAGSGEGCVSYDADDAVVGGWSHADYARAIGRAVGRRIIVLPLPGGMVRLGARVDRRLRGGRAKLTADRASYMCHDDWTIDPARRPPTGLWTPRVATPSGLSDTARWYLEQGWL